MTLNSKGIRLGTGLVAVALLASACGGGSDEPTGTKVAGAKGGQLEVLMLGDFEHLDPQRNYVGSALNFGRLLYRQLTTYKSAPGAAGSELAPDLATNLGTPSDNAKTWTFTLKDGLKYEDGSPITAQDIKYGVERSMSPLIDSGPQYAKQYLVGGTEYSGPYSGKGLDSIVTPDAKTIVFHLKQSHGDFPYTVSLPTFAPVPKAKDTKQNYSNRVFSSGPYKIDSYVRGKSILLSRNANWGQDTVRTALPDTIKATFGLDPAVVDQRIITSAGADANAVTIDTSIQAANVAAVRNQPNLKKRSISGPAPYLRYIAMNTTKKPLNDVKVRKALQYAIDKIAQQTARGGVNAAGEPATTIIAPGIAGHEKYDLYAKPEGDPTKAKQMLADAGYPNGFTATLQTTISQKGKDQAAAFQASMKKIGVTINIDAVDPSVYYTTIGDIKKEPEFVIAAWGPDWPSASTVIPPLFDGTQIVPQGNQNFSQLNDPAVNAEIVRITGISDQAAAAKEWGKLDRKIMEEHAPIFPLLNDAAIYLVGSNVKGAFMHAFYGEPDLASLGVK